MQTYQKEWISYIQKLLEWHYPKPFPASVKGKVRDIQRMPDQIRFTLTGFYSAMRCYIPLHHLPSAQNSECLHQELEKASAARRKVRVAGCTAISEFLVEQLTINKLTLECTSAESIARESQRVAASLDLGLLQIDILTD